MTSLARLSPLPLPTSLSEKKPPVPKPDWPLMGDVATCRAGVPEALILWRKARGETPPQPER
ncbi:MAG: hypothetical protein OIF48_08190 [Silicimonas sp.]|nr:hypothetical protein [Silicimonas sp.]